MSDAAKKIPGENDPLPAERSVEEINELVIKLLNGDVEPASDMATYFVDKLKDMSKEGTELSAMLETGRQQIAELEARISVIRCQSEAYKLDLVEWQDRSE